MRSLSVDTITVERAVKHIPITCLDEVKITGEPGSAEYGSQNMSLMFNEEIVWKDSKPYKLSIINKVIS